MTLDEVKACFPEPCRFFYWDVTQDEIDALAVDHWMGQTAGTLYLATAEEVPALAAKRMTSV